MDQQEAENEYGQHDVIEDHLVRQIDEAEQMTLRDSLDAVLTMRERDFEAEEIDHLRQGQRDHREIDALPANGERADDGAERAGGKGCSDNAEFRRPSPDLGDMGAEIGRRPEEHRMAEEQKSDIADEQVESAGKQR